jgi:predicted nucleotidyltransferase
MGEKQPKIRIPHDRVADFCRRHHIRRLSLFGSTLRDDFGPNSDIDVLVEFEAGKTPSFFKLFDMEDELSAMLEGRKVDLRTPEDLGRFFRQRVLSEAVVQYAA